MYRGTGGRAASARASPADNSPAKQQLHRIIYSSTNLLFDTLDGAGNLREILQWSRRWNPGVGVTGALMMSRNHFAQVLEGPVAAVKTIYGHIVCDRRNTGNLLLHNAAVDERMFPEWSMAYAGSVAEEDIILANGPCLRSFENGQPDDATAVLHLLRFLVRPEG